MSSLIEISQLKDQRNYFLSYNLDSQMEETMKLSAWIFLHISEA